MSELMVLKIGGSVVTEKERTDYTLREDLLREIFLNIKTALAESDRKLILVHGAGGHIHHLAKECELKTGCEGDPKKKQKALEVQATCVQLTSEIIAIGKEVGLPLESVPTHEVVTNENGQISELNSKRIENALETENIPVLYGDMVPDTALELSICSGDKVVAELVAKLPVARALFASDIDGIFTDDPHLNSEAKLLEEVSIADLDSGTISLGESHNVDVTGGLRGKLNECKDIFYAANGLQTIKIFNGLVPENYSKILTEGTFHHTTITN